MSHTFINAEKRHKDSRLETKYFSAYSNSIKEPICHKSSYFQSLDSNWVISQVTPIHVMVVIFQKENLILLQQIPGQKDTISPDAK